MKSRKKENVSQVEEDPIDNTVGKSGGVSIGLLSDGSRVKTFWHGASQISSLIEKGEEETLLEASENVKAAKAKRLEVQLPDGKETTLTAKELRQEVVNGCKVFNKKGRCVPMTKMADRSPERKIRVKQKNKDYYMV